MENNPHDNGRSETAPHELGHEPCASDLHSSGRAKTDAALLSSDIEREVSQAFASMDSADLAELRGDVPARSHVNQTPTSADSISRGTKLEGTVVAVADDDIFLEFGPKAQGIVPRAQFNDGDLPKVGQRLTVVADRFDSEASLLHTHREGAVRRADWDTLEKGAVLVGRVTGLIKGGLEVNVNGLRAFMPGSHADLHPLKDISVLLNDVIRCEVLDVDAKAKNLIVSRRKFMEREQKEQAKTLLAELEVGQIRHGVVGNIAEFGAFVNLGGVDGLVHIRDLSWGMVEKVTDVLTPGQEVDVQVLKIDTKRKRISLGLKQALPDPWKDAENRFPAGTKVKARVLRLADFGAFAEIEAGIEGLIPISEMAWGRVRRAADVVNVGDVVDAAVIRIEPEKRRIALSIKQCAVDPWAEVLQSYTPKSVVKGKVTRIADFGVFIELAPGVEGMAHISELSDQRVRACGDVVSVGQEIEARVLDVDKENRRIALSLKPAHAPAAEGVTAEAAAPEAAKPAKKRKKNLRGGLASHFKW